MRGRGRGARVRMMRSLPVEMAEIGAASSTTVEDEEEVGRGVEKGRADFTPPNFGYRTEAFAGKKKHLSGQRRER